MREQKKKSGIFRWYFSSLGSGAKGAIGAESIKQVGQFAGAAYTSFKYKQCPRCMENSLLHTGDVYKCVRVDICGFETHIDNEIKKVREYSMAVNPRVLALAKGFVGSFQVRANGASKISWLFWVVTACILSYSASWAIDARWGYVTWTFLVAMYTMVNAVRYAYMSYRLVDGTRMSPLEFLAHPGLWFAKFQT